MVRGPYYQLLELRRYGSAIGWRAALRLRFCDAMVRSGMAQPKLFEIKLKNSTFPLCMRTHTSDRDVLSQIFIYREYEIPQLSNPRTIIDLGANVGYSAAYFLSKYPASTVLAVEPDAGNLEVCRRNLAPYGTRAKLVHGAAWPEPGQLVVAKGIYRDGRDWSTQVRPSHDNNSTAMDYVEAFDLNMLLAMCGVAQIDLLKIDIEASELELFSRNADGWLPFIRNLCIELHGAACEEAFFRALANYSYDLSRSGDVVVCRNLEPRPFP